MFAQACCSTVGRYLVSDNAVNPSFSRHILSHVPALEHPCRGRTTTQQPPVRCRLNVGFSSFRREAGRVSAQQAAHVHLSVDHVWRTGHPVQLHADGVSQRFAVFPHLRTFLGACVVHIPIFPPSALSRSSVTDQDGHTDRLQGRQT